MSEISTKEELLAVQRKEKKELVAKTQKMKHGVPKGDKKKKKDVTAEIEQMLADLDIKHNNELKEFEVNECSTEKSQSAGDDIKKIDDAISEKISDDVNADIVNLIPNKAVGDTALPRLSKAQKRRNKKASQEKERQKAIDEQEIENLQGLRHLESEEIMKKLSEKNLTIHEVPSDGNCLYKAVEHQLSSLKLKETTVQSLREQTSKYMLSHMDDYIPFLTCPETGDVLTEEQYIKYCEDIATTAAWGGHTEVQALSQICETPIEIIQAQGPNIITGDENSNIKLILSYHRHAYGLGEHYNSVIPIDG